MVTKIVSGNDPRALPCQLDTSFTFEALTFFYSKSFYISSNSGAKPSVRATESKDSWTVCLDHDASNLPPRPTWRTAFSRHPCTSLRNILEKRNWNILELAPYVLNPPHINPFSSLNQGKEKEMEKGRAEEKETITKKGAILHIN